VPKEWINYNGHVKAGYCVLCTICRWTALAGEDCYWGLDGKQYRLSTSCVTFVVEFHLNSLRELRQSDSILVRSLIGAFDAKRLLRCLELSRTTPRAGAMTLLWRSPRSS
jgi:acyl-CoA thioesterase FadM